MQTFSGLERVPAHYQGVALTMGSFDGLHMGHRSLISQLIDKSKKFNIPAVVMTFDPHPSHVLRPENPAPRLFPLTDLEAELSKLGVDILVIEPFTTALAQTSAQDFMEHVVSRLKPRCLIVGYDFAFGRAREGNWPMLQGLAEKWEFVLEKQPAFTLAGEVVSSSSIRQFLQSGDVERASQYLGRPYVLSGAVVHGEGRGDQLGFPTLNLSTPTEIRLASGVYITRVEHAGRFWPSVTNVGHKPTFHSHSPLTVETHLLNAQENLYHQSIRVEFLRRLRPELKFPSAHALIKQISDDVAAAKKYFGL